MSPRLGMSFAIVALALLFAASANGQRVDSRFENLVCGPQPEGVVQSREFADLLAAYGIEQENVQLLSCNNVGFRVATRDSRGVIQGQVYIPDRYEDAEIGFLLPALAHELAHVFLEDAFKEEAPLTDFLETKEIELGCDFLAGLVFADMFDRDEASGYLVSDELSGSFFELDEDHGNSEERTNAFRTGYFAQRYRGKGRKEAFLSFVADLRFRERAPR